jgi:hypothetical protein
MPMMFQLWEAELANLVGSYETEEAALAIVRKAIENHDRDAIDSLALLHEGMGVQLTTIAEGDALADLALARTSPAA